MMRKLVVLIITGPCAVGKTSIAKIIAQKYGLEYIGGDEIKKNLFPEIARITDFPEKLEIIKKEIFNKAEEAVNIGRSLIIDYVITGRDQLKRYRDTFGDRLLVRVLLPPLDIIQKRDKERSCWSAGEQVVKDLYNKFNELRGILEPDCFIDNSEETPEQTVEKYFGRLGI